MPADWLIDTTLRDGAQAPGVVFSPGARRRIAERLAAIGVGELEAGIPAAGPAAREELRELGTQGWPVRITGWCRAHPADLDAAEQAGLASVHLSLPASAILQGALGWSRERTLDTLPRIVGDARRRFDYVSVGAQDASRATPYDLAAFARAAAGAGADRLRLADTVGVWHPLAVTSAFENLRAAAPELPLAFHGHNDLGMATANTLAALLAGAAAVDVTVNGLGERAGNAPLAEIAMARQVACGQPSGLRVELLRELSQLVAEASGRAVAGQSPVVGDDLFRHESGIHVAAVLKDPRAYEPFAPEVVNHPGRTLELGANSGRAAVRHALHICGLGADDGLVADITPRVHELARREGRNVSLEELQMLAGRG